jgi:hypothetical protein
MLAGGPLKPRDQVPKKVPPLSIEREPHSTVVKTPNGTVRLPGHPNVEAILENPVVKYLLRPEKPTQTSPTKKLTPGNVLSAVLPDGIVLGATGPVPPAVAEGGGPFVIVSSTGKVSFFGTKTLKKPLSIVGTFNVPNVGDNEAGLGLSWKVPSPAGDILFFLNARQNRLTVSSLIRALRDRGTTEHRVTLNVGAAISGSDAALLAAMKTLPGPAAATAATLHAVADKGGVDAWIGLAWSAVAKFKGGRLTSVSISGVEIPVDKIGAVFGERLNKERRSPTLLPNRGSSAVARFNDWVQLVYGQSPWNVGFSAIDRYAGPLRGPSSSEYPPPRLTDKGGVNVLNHGHPVTSVTEPIYELATQYGVLSPYTPITSNAQAGQIIDATLIEAHRRSPTKYREAVLRLLNPYELNFGSVALQQVYKKWFLSADYRQQVNKERIALGLAPLPEPRKDIRPADFQEVRDAFAGKFRIPDLTKEERVPISY